MWSQATEGLTNIAVTLGADVNITCEFNITKIYWYRQKSPDPPVYILNICNSTSGTQYKKNSNFEHKYSVKTNSSLFISNISTEELGVYYCTKCSEAQKFSNGTKIYISDSVDSNQKLWTILIITSVLLNVLLIVAVIGLVKCCLDATRRSKDTSEKPQSTTAAQNTNDPQVR
ncbi:Ig kappa chain V-II region 17S29.1 [Labeo rohita]|uniref:Ig kappa chain V-II region 17S29.1 n=1 Tax=Labeo rohita TaxID=84645 RepID=A0ABQ8L6I9_LABRO|nr:Ig kappa chain V-II region 17S29.1 [Labeo rohita]